MNCRRPVAQNDAQFFDGVFLCPNCHTVAKHIETRLGNELKMMHVMLHEAIRNACCEGKLHLSTDGVKPESSKKEVLEAVVSLMTLKEERKKEPG